MTASSSCAFCWGCCFYGGTNATQLPSADCLLMLLHDLSYCTKPCVCIHITHHVLAHMRCSETNNWTHRRSHQGPALSPCYGVNLHLVPTHYSFHFQGRRTDRIHTSDVTKNRQQLSISPSLSFLQQTKQLMMPALLPCPIGRRTPKP